MASACNRILPGKLQYGIPREENSTTFRRPKVHACLWMRSPLARASSMKEGRLSAPGCFIGLAMVWAGGIVEAGNCGRKARNAPSHPPKRLNDSNSFETSEATQTPQSLLKADWS